MIDYIASNVIQNAFYIAEIVRSSAISQSPEPGAPELRPLITCSREGGELGQSLKSLRKGILRRCVKKGFRSLSPQIMVRTRPNSKRNRRLINWAMISPSDHSPRPLTARRFYAMPAA